MFCRKHDDYLDSCFKQLRNGQLCFNASESSSTSEAGIIGASALFVLEVVEGI